MEVVEQTSSEEVPVRLPNKIDIPVDGDEKEIQINGVPHRQRKEGNKEEEEEETASDGEFIKVEKELIDVKESTRSLKPITEVEESPHAANPDLLAMEEKINPFQHRLEAATRELQHSESEKVLLKSEVVQANEKIEKMDRYCKELELDNKKMKEQISEAEQKYNLQLESTHEALRALDMKHKELVDLKNAYDGLSAELESSRKKMEELEVELESSAGEVHKYKELSDERSSHAELESRKALEFEKALELAKSNTKDMEDQMGNLQEELKELYDKIVKNQSFEEALRNTALELSMVQEKLENSKSNVADLEQGLASKDAFILELNEELNVHKASEKQVREELLASENLLSASKADLQAKLVNLEEFELKLQNEVKGRETIEASVKNQEMHILNLQEELFELKGEKETLLSSIAELNKELSMAKELHSELETKLSQANQNCAMTDSLLAQALTYNEELEQNIKYLEELHHDSRTAAESATQRNLELEGLIQASSAAREGVKAQLRETEVNLTSAEKHNMELEQQLNLAEQKFKDAEREVKELDEKKTELTNLLRKMEDDKEAANCYFQAKEDRISQLEESLERSYSRNLQLEQELKDLAEKCAEHEGRANATHQRSLGLEDLVRVSHSKAEDAGKRMSELELSLEAANSRMHELEQMLSITEAKSRDAEAESKHYSSKVSQLSGELEELQAKAASLEAMLQAADEKERKLTNMLNLVTEERKNFEDMSNDSGQRLLEAENLIEVLQSELESVREELMAVENDLEASGLRESAVLEKLKSAEEQLRHHGRAVEHAKARNLELESLNESLAKDSELKLQEAVGSVTQKELEVEMLHEKLKSLEEEKTFYHDQAIEATEKIASLKAELEATAMKMVTLENTIEGLKRNLADTELQADQSFFENELLAGTNIKLREELEAQQSKVTELHGLLNSLHAEKETTAEQLASHVKTIAKLSDENSRGLELQSETESRLEETEGRLHEAIEKFLQRDAEAKDLDQKLLELNSLLRTHEEQAREKAIVAQSQKVELSDAISNFQNLERHYEEMKRKAEQLQSENEDLVRDNVNLSQELATYEAEMNELQVKLNAVTTEKEDTSAQLYSSKKTIEDLTKQLESHTESLQSQIISAMDENNILNDLYQNVKKELEAVQAQLEERASEHKAREVSLSTDVENLKAELAEKSQMHAQISQLEQQLSFAENKHMEEIKSMQSAAAEKDGLLTAKLEALSTVLHERDALNEQLMELRKELDLAYSTIEEQTNQNSIKELEREAAMKQSLGEIEAQHQHATVLEEQVEELKQKLQIAESQYKEKVKEEGEKLALVNAELDDLKHKLSQTAEMEKKIMELEKKLQLANAKSAEEDKYGITEAEMKDGVEMKSRDFEVGMSTPSIRKNKTRSEEMKSRDFEVHQSAETISTAQTVHVHDAHQPSGLMAFKFILGVALVSVIIGIILGKRY